MAENVGTGEVTLVPDVSKFGAALQSKLTPTLASTGTALSGALKGFTNSLGVAVPLAAGAAAIAVGKFAADSIDAYRQSEVAVTQLNSALKNAPQLANVSTAAFEEQAHALQNLTGFTDEAILGVDAILSRFGATEDQLKRLVPLTLDYARATGQDVQSAAGNIGRALLGNARALKAVGIQFKATGNSAEDLSRIMDLLEGKVGGTAEAFGKTGQGQIEIFAAQVDDLKEAIGAGLIPVLTQFIRTATPILQKAAEQAKGAGEAYQFYFDVQSNNKRVEAEAAAEHNATAAALYDETQAARIAAAAQDGLTGSVEQSSQAFGNAGKIMRGFTDAADFHKWERESRDALTGVTGALKDLSGQTKVTAGDILKSFTKQITIQQKYRDNWEELLARGAPASLLEQLQSMGLDGAKVLNALANANDQKFDQIIAKWTQSIGVAKDTANDIEAVGRAVKILPDGRVITIRANISQAQDALNSLERQMRAVVGGTINPIKSAKGYSGVVTSPTLFLAGEAGPESVQITPQGQRAAGMGGGYTLVFNGDVYGMDDFERKVGSAVAATFAKAAR